MYNQNRKEGTPMNIVVLDGGTTNPGDLSWEPLGAFGRLTVYGQTPQGLAVQRLEDAQAVILNRLSLGREESPAAKAALYGHPGTGVQHHRREGAPGSGGIIRVQCSPLLRRVSGSARPLPAAVPVQQGPALRWHGAGRALGPSGGGEPPFPFPSSAGRKAPGHCGHMAAQDSAWQRWGWPLEWRCSFSAAGKKPGAPAGCRWVGLETLFQESDAVSLPLPADRGNPGAWWAGSCSP